MKLRKAGQEQTFRIRATDDPRGLGEQDYVIIGMKAHSIPAVVEQFAPLLGHDTAVVPAVNGLPWWYFHGANTGTALDETWLETIDPGGVQWKFFGPERAIGCVVYPACDVPEPGVVHHSAGAALPWVNRTVLIVHDCACCRKC